MNDPPELCSTSESVKLYLGGPSKNSPVGTPVLQIAGSSSIPFNRGSLRGVPFLSLLMFDVSQVGFSWSIWVKNFLSVLKSNQSEYEETPKVYGFEFVDGPAPNQ